MRAIHALFEMPRREYLVSFFVVLSFFATWFFPAAKPLLVVAIVLGALPTFLEALRNLYDFKITIDVFNMLAVVVAFAAVEVQSGAFIVLMLSFARLLDHHTKNETRNSIQKLLSLKPEVATIEKAGLTEQIPSSEVRVGDTVVVKNGERVPVDGVVVYGEALINQAAVTGESVPAKKGVGDEVLSLSLNESGALKIRALHVGTDSLVDRMVRLMREASENKSRSERIADSFARLFLPIVALIGLVTYLVTKNASMTAALFLVACADDMAVAIPLAMTAALGSAARRGVIIKGGEYLDVLSRVDTLIFDKTGTLTYGSLGVSSVVLQPSFDEISFWRIVGSLEKFSEHPIGRALVHEALKKISDIPDPESFEVLRGEGVRGVVGGQEVAFGTLNLAQKMDAEIPPLFLSKSLKESLGTQSFLILNRKVVASVNFEDGDRPEARASIDAIRRLGVERIIMFTGDSEKVAMKVAARLGIDDVRSQMLPEEKLRALERLVKDGRVVAMVGDGINDAPALARAHVGIAMGNAGTAVAVEAADVVILHDDLSRISEMIVLSRKTMRVIRGDIAIWMVTNLVGFYFVFDSVFGPALAAFYNFATDFLPLVPSVTLFSRRTSRTK